MLNLDDYSEQNNFIDAFTTDSTNKIKSENKEELKGMMEMMIDNLNIYFAEIKSMLNKEDRNNSGLTDVQINNPVLASQFQQRPNQFMTPFSNTTRPRYHFRKSKHYLPNNSVMIPSGHVRFYTPRASQSTHLVENSIFNENQGRSLMMNNSYASAQYYPETYQTTNLNSSETSNENQGRS